VPSPGTPSDGPSAAPSPIPPPLPALSATAIDPPRLDRVLASARTKHGIPGISATLVFADGSSWTGVSGYADVARKRLVEPDTVFAAASVSKTFTAALVLSLVEEGRLSLTDRVHDRVPDLPTNRIPKAVTIRMLLDHTSGIADYYLHPKINGVLLADRDRRWTSAQVLRYVGKPWFKAGTDWRYSNTNYYLLGLVAEAVTGRSLASELHARFLDPLGLEHTTVQGYERSSGPGTNAYRFTSTGTKAKPVALGDGSGIMPFTSVVTASGAAGSIASTSGDLARWGKSLYGGDALDGTTRAMMLGSIDGTTSYKPSVPYGYGVQRVTVLGHEAFGHSGRFLGARALVRYLPDTGLSVAVLANTSRTDLRAVLGSLVKATMPVPAREPAVPVPSALPSGVPTD
jgi:D-alanyl-D-alanine carboxypeptidase